VNSTIVSSKELGTKCWSAIRFLGECQKCSRVISCVLPEATQARIKIAHQRILVAKSQIENERAKIEALLQEAGKELAG